MTDTSSGDVLAFWRQAGPTRWFRKNAEFDAEFRDRFLGRHEAATRGELDGWAASAEGALALLVLLDQFPRNAFRDTPRTFATDARALAIAKQSIAAGFDFATDTGLRNFFYLPLMHSENLGDQQQAVGLTAALGGDPHRFALLHRDIVARCGRFPHRNPILGRDTTAQEQQFLDEGGFAG
jgi:uncharacterized protein (DUF924 family)